MPNNEMKHTCPYCSGVFEVDFKFTSTTQDINIKEPQSDSEPTILSALLKYQRWCAEGQIPYYHGNNATKDNRQYYYDTYHDHIEYLPDEDCYYYRIQIYDSPEGDTWIKGKVKIINKYNDWGIEIIENESVRT